MLKLSASPSMCKQLGVAEQRSTGVAKKSAGKPDAGGLVRERLVPSMLQKSSDIR